MVGLAESLPSASPHNHSTSTTTCRGLSPSQGYCNATQGFALSVTAATLSHQAFGPNTGRLFRRFEGVGIVAPEAHWMGAWLRNKRVRCITMLGAAGRIPVNGLYQRWDRFCMGKGTVQDHGCSRSMTDQSSEGKREDALGVDAKLNVE